MQEKRLAVTVPQRLDGATVKEVARSCLSLSSTRLKKAKRVPGGILRNGRGVTVVERVRAGDVLSIVIEEARAPRTSCRSPATWTCATRTSTCWF